MRWVDHEGSCAVALWGLSHASIFVLPPEKSPADVLLQEASSEPRRKPAGPKRRRSREPRPPQLHTFRSSLRTMRYHSSWPTLGKPKRVRRRRGESAADTNSRHFRELEAKYLSLDLSPKAATSAAMKEMLIALSMPAPRRRAKVRA